MADRQMRGRPEETTQSVSSGNRSVRSVIARLGDQRRLVFLLSVLVIYIAVFQYFDGLRFAPSKDEVHFWETVQTHFTSPFPPSLETLRGYREIITPLAFIVWGQLDRVFDAGLFPGRMLNLVLSFTMTCWVGMRLGREDPNAILAAFGLLLYPYYLGLSVHLYTDIFAAFFMFGGFWLYGRRRLVWSFVFFVLAVSSRQYMIAFPLALAAWEFLAGLRGDRRHWLNGIGPLLAGASVVGWFVFFGGLGPKPGVEHWIPRYPAPMSSLFAVIPEYALYHLACVGFYFVVPEFLFFRRWRQFEVRDLLALGPLLIATGVLALFVAFPPLFPERPMGMFDRGARLVLSSDFARVSFYYLLTVATCLRFSRMDLASWIVLANACMIMKAQLAWDKYLLPTMVVLWYLRSRNVLDGGSYPVLPPRDSGARPVAGGGLLPRLRFRSRASGSPCRDG